MIIYDKILFVNTPRTASRAISEVLYKNKGLVIGQHHNEPLEALQTARANNLTIITLTREPKEQVESWYWHIPEPIRPDFTTFISSWKDGWYFPNLNPYKDIADKVLDYKEGIKEILRHLGLVGKIKVPVIGKNTKSSLVWSEEDLNIFSRRFADDIKFYEENKYAEKL